MTSAYIKDLCRTAGYSLAKSEVMARRTPCKCEHCKVASKLPCLLSGCIWFISQEQDSRVVLNLFGQQPRWAVPKLYVAGGPSSAQDSCSRAPSSCVGGGGGEEGRAGGKAGILAPTWPHQGPVIREGLWPSPTQPYRGRGCGQAPQGSGAMAQPQPSPMGGRELEPAPTQTQQESGQGPALSRLGDGQGMASSRQRGVGRGHDLAPTCCTGLRIWKFGSREGWPYLLPLLLCHQTSWSVGSPAAHIGPADWRLRTPGLALFEVVDKAAILVNICQFIRWKFIIVSQVAQLYLKVQGLRNCNLRQFLVNTLQTD